jgi:hypothetical protein
MLKVAVSRCGTRSSWTPAVQSLAGPALPLQAELPHLEVHHFSVQVPVKLEGKVAQVIQLHLRPTDSSTTQQAA